MIRGGIVSLVGSSPACCLGEVTVLAFSVGALGTSVKEVQFARAK